MLTGAQMGGMDEMGLFYDSCLQTLYPPGSCGTFCNEHTFECYVGEIHEACCTDNGANCQAGSMIPQTCPVGCAIVFPEFMETCRSHMGSHPEIDLAAFEVFEQDCLTLDGLALVDYAMELIYQGCYLDLRDTGGGGGGGGHRRLMELLQRRLQAAGGWMSSRFASDATGVCEFDDLDDFAMDVDYSCCGADGSKCTAGGAPTECSAACAVAIHQFTTTCAGTLSHVLTPTDPLMTQITAFEAVCMTTVESSHLFIDAIMGAVCPEFGRTVLVQEYGADATGWDNVEITDVGSAGIVHGPYGNDVTDVTREITIPPGVSSCEVTWRSWAIDSRDNEVDSVTIDGVEAWSQAVSCPGTDWEIGPPDFPNPWGGQDDGRVCFQHHVYEAPCSGTMHVVFHSGIDQSEDDEGWAFSDFSVIGATGESTILAEDEHGGALATGWTNTEVTDVGSAGLVHGPWGNDATDISITLPVPNDMTECEVSWRSWAIDSRDGEVDSVQIDGVEVWAEASTCYQGNDGWEVGPSDFPNVWGAGNEVCFRAVTVQVACSISITINFLSGIDQAEADESWAFSDVRVISRPGQAYGNAGAEERVLLQESEIAIGGAAPGSWSNGEVTDVGSAGKVHGPYGNDVTDVTLDVAVPSGFSACEVSWRQWAIDSRDGETDTVAIDGVEVWSAAVSCPGAVSTHATPTTTCPPWIPLRDCFCMYCRTGRSALRTSLTPGAARTTAVSASRTWLPRSRARALSILPTTATSTRLRMTKAGLSATLTSSRRTAKARCWQRMNTGARSPPVGPTPR